MSFQRYKQSVLLYAIVKDRAEDGAQGRPGLLDGVGMERPYVKMGRISFSLLTRS